MRVPAVFPSLFRISAARLPTAVASPELAPWHRPTRHLQTYDKHVPSAASGDEHVTYCNMYVFDCIRLQEFRNAPDALGTDENGASFAHPLHSSGRPVSCALVIKFARHHTLFLP